MRGFPVKTPEEFEKEAQIPPAAAADPLERRTVWSAGSVCAPKDIETLMALADAKQLPAEVTAAVGHMVVALQNEADEEEDVPDLESDDSDGARMKRMKFPWTRWLMAW
ncbi:hypothetical protein CYMTET_6005 [Cymbomonas tetramitiformis]|uniref:Uncharacterized protein n=1 Tax=Cymbomonas tetramitiformis TaxID=36881 RepID=A0AAE0GYB4_9CHLO|nr:hypothetical protein CYMTET_6005 [Cymbomonas tetramitiformis]